MFCLRYLKTLACYIIGYAIKETNYATMRDKIQSKMQNNIIKRYLRQHTNKIRYVYKIFK